MKCCSYVKKILLFASQKRFCCWLEYKIYCWYNSTSLKTKSFFHIKKEKRKKKRKLIHIFFPFFLSRFQTVKACIASWRNRVDHEEKNIHIMSRTQDSNEIYHCFFEANPQGYTLQLHQYVLLWLLIKIGPYKLILSWESYSQNSDHLQSNST